MNADLAILAAVAGLVGTLIGLGATWGAMRSTVRALDAEVAKLRAAIEPMAQLVITIRRLDEETQRRAGQDGQLAVLRERVDRMQVEIDRLREGMQQQWDLSGRIRSGPPG